MAALARARAAQVEETEDETRRRVEWIKHYVKIGQSEKARELGWDGKPIEAPASAEITSERQQKLQRAASSRMAGLRIVLEDCEDVGNRAAILRTAEAFGLLHIHEIPGAELKTPNGRAKKIGVAHSGQKWLRISVHSSAAECVAALRAAGCESILAAVPAAAAIPPSESWHAARVRNRGGAEAEADDAARKAAVDALTATALEHVDFGRHTALCFGNERLGVSAALAAACDGAMTIPMYGLTESLNVSVAAALAIHYGRVARAKALGAERLNAAGGDMSAAEVEALLAEYTAVGRGQLLGSGDDLAQLSLEPR